jgi:hypothetical protein
VRPSAVSDANPLRMSNTRPSASIAATGNSSNKGKLDSFNNHDEENNDAM